MKAVLAKSFAYIHKRNLVNEAIPFFVVTDAGFHSAVEDGSPLEIRLAAGCVVTGGKEYPIEAVSPIARQIQARGGIVAAVQAHGSETFDLLTAEPSVA